MYCTICWWSCRDLKRCFSKAQISSTLWHQPYLMKRLYRPDYFRSLLAFFIIYLLTFFCILDKQRTGWQGLPVACHSSVCGAGNIWAEHSSPSLRPPILFGKLQSRGRDSGRQYCGSGITQILRQKALDPGSGSATKNSGIVFLPNSQKNDPECLSRIPLIPDLDFFSHPGCRIQGSNAPNPGFLYCV